MHKYPSSLQELAKEQLFYPSEQAQKVKSSKKSISIGIPKERATYENRISLTPDAVEILVSNGHEVKFETNAGVAAHFSDDEYSAVGAITQCSREEVFGSEIVLKVEPPTFDELYMIKDNQTLISALQIAKTNRKYIEAVNKKKLTCIAYEFIRDKKGGLPLMRAMSEIAGSTVMLVAAEYLNSLNDGKGIILGGITGVPPTKVVIIGAGTVGEYAVKTALGLGAEVKVFDKHLYKLRRLRDSIGQQIYTSTLNSVTLAESLSETDVAIGALRADEGRSPCVVTEEMVMNMKPNSVIIDVSIDQGGCFETSEIRTPKRPIFKKHDVIHYCVPNIASRVAHTSSMAVSNIFTPFLLEIADFGGVDKIICRNDWFSRSVYAYRGKLTHSALAYQLGMEYSDLSLLRRFEM